MTNKLQGEGARGVYCNRFACFSFLPSFAHVQVVDKIDTVTAKFHQREAFLLTKGTCPQKRPHRTARRYLPHVVVLSVVLGEGLCQHFVNNRDNVDPLGYFKNGKSS